MDQRITVATNADVADIFALRSRVADKLARDFGRGHWSHRPTESSILRGIATSRVLVARSQRTLLGTLRLATKKPWAIDVSYFVPVNCALYLHDLAVEPAIRNRGVGRRLIQAALTAAREWPAQSIRLDAYDAPAGAAAFYAKCGFQEIGRVTYRKVPLVYLEFILTRLAIDL